VGEGLIHDAFIPLIPAQAGSQSISMLQWDFVWAPAFAGTSGDKANSMDALLLRRGKL
jgi:hypothetical protein